ncbi:MAG: Crp/Fnr family transcriptional regulator [Saprospirales bacterium]|nr:MAG: Crp/Fnr family transcriptional regulator [Saprospirales bacterium]
MDQTAELKEHIKLFFGLGEKELKKINTFFKPKSLLKGEYYLKTGQYTDKLAFVKSGILREFLYFNDKEVTKWISTNGGFVVDLQSFVFNQPARWNIQALTDCELLVLEASDYKQILKVIPNWPKIEKTFIAKCFIIMEERIVQHLSLSAEERYQKVFEYNKELFNQVPLKYLASMLGMTPETFSRIRKKITGN